MNVLFGFLTVILFLDCVVLVFLVLLQLPKKEAGAGMAFGGAATDALFGAGSGNALTTITKYAAGIFFGLSLLMGIMSAHQGKSGASALQDALTKAGAAGHVPVTQPSTAPATAPAGSNFLEMAPPANVAPAGATAPAAASNSALPGLQLQTPAPPTNK
jgi:preprotein translocase subunit SecG